MKQFQVWLFLVSFILICQPFLIDAKKVHKPGKLSDWLAYTIVGVVILIGLLGFSIYFCLACGRANSSQSSNKSKRHRAQGNQKSSKPSSSKSTSSMDSIESRENSNSRLAPLAQPNDPELSIKESVQKTLARLEYQAIASKKNLVVVD